jgi:hypothetical protein
VLSKEELWKGGTSEPAEEMLSVGGSVLYIEQARPRQQLRTSENVCRY